MKKLNLLRTAMVGQYDTLTSIIEKNAHLPFDSVILYKGTYEQIASYKGGIIIKDDNSFKTIGGEIICQKAFHDWGSYQNLSEPMIIGRFDLQFFVCSKGNAELLYTASEIINWNANELVFAIEEGHRIKLLDMASREIYTIVENADNISIWDVAFDGIIAGEDDSVFYITPKGGKELLYKNSSEYGWDIAACEQLGLIISTETYEKSEIKLIKKTPNGIEEYSLFTGRYDSFITCGNGVAVFTKDGLFYCTPGWNVPLNVVTKEEETMYHPYGLLVTNDSTILLIFLP